MRTTFVCSLLLFAFSMVPARAAVARPGNPVLWYTHPAQEWKDALPVGNGRLGAMVFGLVAKERIQLNEDTVWNGKKRDRVNPEALKALPELRRLLFEGRAAEAETLAEEKLVGIPHRQPPYQPLGDLNLEFAGLENASDYRRELNLATGIARVSYRVGGASCTREVFSSAPAQAIVVRISCANPGMVSFRATLAREQDSQTTVAAPDRVILQGEAKAHSTYWQQPWMTPERRKAELDQIEPTGVRFQRSCVPSVSRTEVSDDGVNSPTRTRSRCSSSPPRTIAAGIRPPPASSTWPARPSRMRSSGPPTPRITNSCFGASNWR
jgi:hypothetical protein